MTTIAIEGLDGAGKSQQTQLLLESLSRRGLSVRYYSLYRTPVLMEQFDRLNAARLISARDASLMTAAELGGRLSIARAELQVLSLWDKHVVGARARDAARGVAPAQLSAIYDPLATADFTVFLDVTPEVALQRKKRDARPGLWESGLDLAMNVPVEEIRRRLDAGEIPVADVDAHFVRFQAVVRAQYEKLLPKDTERVDGHAPVAEVASSIVKAVSLFLDHRGLETI